MDTSDILLYGTNNQKAEQLIALLKDKQLSPEQLDKLIPHTKEFLKELTNVIKRQTEIEKSNYDKIIDSSLQIIDNLLNSMGNAPTESERLQIVSSIDRIHERMAEIHKNEKIENQKSKSLFAILGGILLGIVFILTAGFLGRSDDKSS